ncbi:hypothetical protein H1R20_g9790, partial [Candolleomyces eurysporus]
MPTGKSKGTSRHVNKPYLRKGKGGGGSSILVPQNLGPQALEAARVEAEKTREHVYHLLGPHQSKILSDICHDAHDEEVGDFGVGADIEEVPITVDDIASLGDLADAVMDVTYDQYVTRLQPGWRARTTQFNENWGNVDDLATAFLQWKDLSSANPNAATAPHHPALPVVEFDMELVDMFSQERKLHVCLPDNETIVPHLIVEGYLPTTPINPLVAISLRTLEFYKIVRQRKPSFSVESFTKVLCDLYERPYQRRWRRLFADSFEVYLSITNEVERRVKAALNRSSEHWRVLNACPACMYELEGEPELRYRLEIAMDGNDSQKRMKDKGMAGDVREFKSDYMIPLSEVDVWTDTQLESNEEVMATDDSAEDDTVKECVKNWKAAQSDSQKKATGIFDETGWFATARLLRHATKFRRSLYLDLYLKQADADKYLQIGNMLLGNYEQAHQIIRDEGLLLNEALEVEGITTADLDLWQSEQRQYFESNLGKEPEEDLHRIAYVELLIEYAGACEKSHSKGLTFCNHIPQDYDITQNIVPETYASTLSKTRQLETQRRQAREQVARLHGELMDMELRLHIEKRWDPMTAAYRETVEKINQRQYRKALEEVQKLVVQRLFELHRLNLSSIGYKARVMLAKAMRTRSRAIQAAIGRYNQAVVALGRSDTLDFARAAQYNFIEEFELLKHSHADLTSVRWKEPRIRDALKRHQRIKRAHEEIERVHIEMRRVYSAIDAEQEHFKTTLRNLKESQDPVYAAVDEFCRCRLKANRVIMSKLYEITDLPTYQGPELTRGRRKGEPASERTLEIESRPFGDDIEDAGEVSGEDDEAEDQAENINKLNDLCKGKVTKAVSGLPRIQKFLSLIEDYDVGLLSRCCQRLYGVWELHQGAQEIHRTIFVEYSFTLRLVIRDYSHLAKDLPGVHSSRQHRKFFDLITPIVWILARGDKQYLIKNQLTQYLPPSDRQKEFDTPDTRTRTIDPNVITVTDDEEADGELPQLSSPSSSVTAPPVINLVTPPSLVTTRARSKVTQRLPAPASSASAFTKNAKGSAKRALSPTEDASLKSLRPAPSVPAWLSTTSNFPDCLLSSPPLPSSTMSTSISSASTLTAASTALASSSNRPTMEHLSTPMIREALIFMRHRATDGTITGSMKYDDPAFQTFPLPESQHLPLPVVDYVRSHGYGRDMMVLIETAMAAAGGQELNFIKAMGLQNYPGAEAGFIWRLAHGSHAL